MLSSWVSWVVLSSRASWVAMDCLDFVPYRRVDCLCSWRVVFAVKMFVSVDRFHLCLNGMTTSECFVESADS